MNTFFEKFGLAFVISLPNCTERRERTIQEFTKWNIPFMFIDAIDRADVTVGHCLAQRTLRHQYVGLLSGIGAV